MARRISDPPPLDTKTFVARIRDIAAKVGLGPFTVFSDGALPRFHQWIRAEGEYDGDGKGLLDTVNSHATEINSHKANIDALATINDAQKARLDRHDERLDALEAGAPPFPFEG